MKRMMGTVLVAGFLVVTADLEAAERRFVRVESMNGPKAKVALMTGPQLLAANDSGSPPSATANENAVPQASANKAVPQAPANDVVPEASADDAVPAAPVNDAVPIAPANDDALSLPPAPLPPVAPPGSPQAMPLPEAGPPGPALGPTQVSPAVTGPTQFGQTQFGPVTYGPALPVPGSVAAGSPPLQYAPAPALFPRVKYVDRRHIAPCAVPMIVAVRDPRDRHERCCGPPKSVLVQILVPPNGMPRVSARPDGTKVRYDYGQYAVNITSKHGFVVVNYDR